MNKQDLINEIAARGALNKAQASQALDALGGIAQAHLIMPGAELVLPGIGKLKAVAKPGPAPAATRPTARRSRSRPRRQ